MKCAIMQPTYLPWLGYFDLIDQVDKFVFLDTAQVSKQSWHVRNRIKTSTGALCISLSYRKDKGYKETLLCSANINDDVNWRQKHLKSLELAYAKARFFSEVYPFLEELIKNHFNILSEFTINIIQNIAREIGIKNTQLIRASQMKALEGTKDTLLALICKHLGCTEYLSPQGSAVYLEKYSPGGILVKSGIKLFYHNYEHPVYRQLYGDFIPCLSVVDLLFNYGFQESLAIIRSGRRPVFDYLTLRDKMQKSGSLTQ